MVAMRFIGTKVEDAHTTLSFLLFPKLPKNKENKHVSFNRDVNKKQV
jgi:hypothetical protein